MSSSLASSIGLNRGVKFPSCSFGIRICMVYSLSSNVYLCFIVLALNFLELAIHVSFHVCDGLDLHGGGGKFVDELSPARGFAARSLHIEG